MNGAKLHKKSLTGDRGNSDALGVVPEVIVGCVVDATTSGGVVSSSSCFRTSGQHFFLPAVCMVDPVFLAACVCLKEFEMPRCMLCVLSLEFSSTIRSGPN